MERKLAIEELGVGELEKGELEKGELEKGELEKGEPLLAKVAKPWRACLSFRNDNLENS